MKDKHTPGPWHKHDPNKEGSYICRMKNGYIKMCYWGTTKWTDIWQTTLDGEVKEWMTIPGDELPVDPNARLMAASPKMYEFIEKLATTLIPTGVAHSFASTSILHAIVDSAKNLTKEIEGDE